MTKKGGRHRGRKRQPFNPRARFTGLAGSMVKRGLITTEEVDAIIAQDLGWSKALSGLVRLTNERLKERRRIGR